MNERQERGGAATTQPSVKKRIAKEATRIIVWAVIMIIAWIVTYKLSNEDAWSILNKLLIGLSGLWAAYSIGVFIKLREDAQKEKRRAARIKMQIVR